MRLKKYSIIAVMALLFAVGPLTAHAQVTSNLWKFISGVLSPSVVNMTTFRIPSLGSSGVPCVTIANTLGDFATTTCGSGASFPFTPATNYAVLNQATTGIAWFQNGLNASSTSHFVYASTTAVTATTICLTGDTCLTSWPTGTFPFSPFSWGNATSTTIGFNNGIISNASSTFSSALRLSSLSAGGVGIGAGGLVYTYATTAPSSASSTLFSDTNTWTGLNVFGNASSTNFSALSASTSNLSIGNLNGPLQAQTGVVSATSSLEVVYGGTGVSAFSRGAIFSNGGIGDLISTTSPTLTSYIATGTTASIFPYASTTALSVSGTLGFSVGTLNGPLQAQNGLVSATSSLEVFYGGTGVSVFSRGIIMSNGGLGDLISTTSPTVAYYVATSTTASIFPYASSTAISATQICLTGDVCRSTWPSGSASTTLLGDVNTFTGGLNQFLRASTTLLSTYGTLYVGSTATSTIQGATTGTSTLQGFLTVSGTNSTSTFSGNLAAGTTSATSLIVTGVSTSTFAGGVNITSGCFAISGTCVSSSAGSSAYTLVGATATSSISNSNENISTTTTVAIGQYVTITAALTGASNTYTLNVKGAGATTTISRIQHNSLVDGAIPLTGLYIPTANESVAVYLGNDALNYVGVSKYSIVISKFATTSGSGGGGSSTWTTGASSVSGTLVNYPNNASDVVTIGSTATTSAEFFLDPNTNYAKLGTTTKMYPAYSCSPQTGSERFAPGGSHLFAIGASEMTWAFDDATSSSIYCSFLIPEKVSSVPRLRIMPSISATTSGNAIMDIEATSTNQFADNMIPNAFTVVLNSSSTAANLFAVVGSASYPMVSTTTALVSNTLNAGGILLVRFTRYGADADDTVSNILVMRKNPMIEIDEYVKDP